MKKTQQDCSTEGLDISVCYNLVINKINSHIKCFTHFFKIYNSDSVRKMKTLSPGISLGIPVQLLIIANQSIT